MQTIREIKYLGFDFGFEEFKEDGQTFSPILMEIIAVTENNGEITDIKKQVRLTDTSFSNFLTGEDIITMSSSVSETISPVEFIQLFKKAMAKMLASDTGLTLADDPGYIAPPTLSEQMQLLKLAVDDIIFSGGAL